MTTPGPEAVPPTAQPFVPIDQSSRFGWTHPHQLPATESWIDLHKLGAVGSVLLASAAATAICSATNTEIPVLTHAYSWTDTNTQHHTISTTTETGPVNVTAHRQSTKIVPAKAQTIRYGVDAGNMPDVTSFNLSITPEAQIIINQSDFSTFVDKLVEDIKDGYSIDNLTVDGIASDETRLDANAGIGKHDPQNLSLAKQYQDFVHEALTTKLKQHGIVVPAKLQHGTPTEAVLDKEDVAAVEADRKYQHLKTNLDLIEAWKTHPRSLDESTVNLLDEMLADVRGANIKIHLKSPAGHTITKEYDTTSKYCVTTDTTYETTSISAKHHGHKVPLTIIPLVIPRIRRRPRPEQTKTPKNPDTAPVVNEPTDSEEVIPPTGNPNPPQPGSGRARIPRPERPVRVRREHPGLRKALGMTMTGAMAAGGLLFVASLRGDVGYCPNLENHAKQDFTWGKMFNYFGVRLQIPFTDIKTGQLPLGDTINEQCDTGQVPTPQNPAYVHPQAPTCDTRSIVVHDGRTISNQLSNDALKQVTTTRIN